MTLKRRDFILKSAASALALAAPSLGASEALAMGRTPLGGKLSFHVPWPTTSLDPHDLRDPLAAIFASAIVDPLFGLDASGAPYPALAASMPTREAGKTVVRLREGLHTARGAPLDARDMIFSIERARARGASAILWGVPRPTTRRGDPYAIELGPVDPHILARVLASPMIGLVPRRFTPAAPDGTGAFRAATSSGRLLLTRNVAAARGASFLDAIEVRPAPDLKASLRAFEAERDDLGWLGLGLHDARRGASRFDLGGAAWVVLHVGPDSGAYAVPGLAQRLVDAIRPERLAHLGLGPLPAAHGDPAWPGPPADLYVDESSPHLLEVARAVVPVLSSPGHEITLTPVPRDTVKRRLRGKAALAIDVVRPVGHSSRHALVALATSEDPMRGRDVARTHPFVAPHTPVRSLTRLLRVGVIGDIRIAGGQMPEVVLARRPLGDGWDLGASFQRPSRRPS
jgi:peptide/nickel transport system substrate-binding protein